MKNLLLLAALTLPLFASAQTASPYVGEQTRSIKALSDSDVSGYLAGKGMGLARAAELNRYPGPRHVLDMADALQLTPEQVAQLKQFFTDMERAAKTAGADLVARERELDALFAQKHATPEQVLALTIEIGRLQGIVRAAHLNAHVATAAILTPAQIAHYAEARGYNSPDNAAPSAHDPSKHSHHG
jgi:Spy/CpxP family protein refolding chaperone